MRGKSRQAFPNPALGVSVVVPVHGNGATLTELTRRIRAALPGRPLQIVMVDDASPDDAAAVLPALGVTVVTHARRQGQNAAILSGLAQAEQPFTCVLDGDLQDPPELLPLLLAPLECGEASVVFSGRGGAHRASSRLFRGALRALFPSLPSHACLCFALDAGGRRALLAWARDTDYLVAVIGALGLRAAMIEGVRTVRPRGRSSYGELRRLGYGAQAFVSALQWRMRARSARRR